MLRRLPLEGRRAHHGFAVRHLAVPALLAILAAATPAVAAERMKEGSVVDTLPTVEVVDQFDQQITRYESASQGAVTQARMQGRPVYRNGEMLETIPGVIISQHSGEGKANQYYLRGFNLDHGTDFASFVAGIPVNMPTHAHGQGYSDLGFVIPELVGGVEYRKGTTFAEEGDFAAAGAAHIAYVNTLARPLAEVTYDRFGYRRALLGGSLKAGGRDLLAAIDLVHNDGPWTHPDDYQKVAGVLRWGSTGERSGLRLTAMGYDGQWNSTDQIPERAVDDGSLSRYGTIDPSDGGRSHRYSLSAEWQGFDTRHLARATVYALDYKLNLWSNFTYALDDTVNGDQFEQADDRTVTGLRASYTFKNRSFAGRAAEYELGLDSRGDLIRSVGLYNTVKRARISTTRVDRVNQASVSPYAVATIQWRPDVRTTLGLRSDNYWFDVSSDNPLNSGNAHSSIVSPKVSVTLGPWSKTAYFASFGTGFHSNDARGSTITVDPSTGDPAERVSPLVRATGAELGVRTVAVPGLVSGLSLWGLDLESELLFIGDAGTTEASRPSRRIGVEWSNAWTVGGPFNADADFAYSKARFSDDAPEGDYIPGAVEGVVAAGINATDVANFFGGVRYRYFGPRPLTEDNSVRSLPSSTFNAQLGYQFSNHVRVLVDGFNLFNAEVSDIDYYYESRLPGEAAGVEDIHFHPLQPRTFRFAITASL